MKNNVLFVTEGYCDGDPDKGLTNNYHNLFGSFKRSYPEIPFNVLHFDEALVRHNTHIDKILPVVYEKYKPNIIMMSLMGKYQGNPTLDSFKYLKDKGCKICVHWPDTGYSDSGWGIPQIEQLGDLVDLNVSWDNPVSDFHKNYVWPKNHINLFVPQDPKLFYKNIHQDIPISFIGGVNNQERQLYLNHAINVNKLQILVRGGQRNEKLSPEQYAQLIRRSKIGINFSFSAGSFWQTKGRVYEILACNSLLFEGANGATSKLLTSGEHYVEYSTPEDFVEKCRYYLSHEEEAKKIAAQGYKTFQEKYTAKKFWETILERIENDRNKTIS